MAPTPRSGLIARDMQQGIVMLHKLCMLFVHIVMHKKAACVLCACPVHCFLRMGLLAWLK